MSSFKHHSRFPKEKAVQGYLFPNVCFACRKSFKKPQCDEPRLCPQCEGPMVELSRKFRSPKSTEVEQWKKVEFLVSRGFLFQSVREQREDGGWYLVDYPETLKEAREFVLKYIDQAVGLSGR